MIRVSKWHKPKNNDIWKFFHNKHFNSFQSEIMASLQGLDHIGEKIFKVHEGMDILNFRLVCKSWQEILDNPMYWLKKLKKIGQSKKAHSDTLVLIRKASKAGIPLTKIGYCLLIKYVKITSTILPQNKQKICRAFS